MRTRSSSVIAKLIRDTNDPNPDRFAYRHSSTDNFVGSAIGGAMISKDFALGSECSCFLQINKAWVLLLQTFFQLLVAVTTRRRRLRRR